MSYLFIHEDTSLKAETLPGRPETETTYENIDKIQ